MQEKCGVADRVYFFHDMLLVEIIECIITGCMIVLVLEQKCCSSMNDAE